MMRRSLLAVTLWALGCGGAEKGAVEPGEDQKIDMSEEPADRGGRGPVGPPDEGGGAGDEMAVQGLKGKLEPFEIQAGIEPHQGALSSCYQSRVSKFRYLKGKVEMQVDVALDGTVKKVQLTESSLGAWPVEKCLLDVTRSMTFTEPKGGEAEFSVPLDFDSGRGYVAWWEEERAEEEVSEVVGELDACPEEAETERPVDVWITMYVGRRGKVRSVGFGSKSKKPPTDAWADCAEEKIREWALSDPKGRIAKLSFRYNAP